MSARVSQAIELVAPYCDVVERLRFIPPSAMLRGLYFQNVEKQVERMGGGSAYRSYFPSDRYFALQFYPLGELLVRMACAGALVASPADVHQGIRAISRGHAEAIAQSLLGRVLVRLLSRDPLRLTQQGLAARRQTCRYGRWSLEPLTSHSLRVTYEDEFNWIESAVHGSAEGTYVACIPEVRVQTEVTGRFSGWTIMSW